MAYDGLAVQLALRNKALAVVVCTTGSTSLSATSTGFARASGSFVTDGFVAGMEVVPSGFVGNTEPKVVKSVTALALTVNGGANAEGPDTGRTLSVGLPRMRTFANQETTDVNDLGLGSPVDGPTVGRWHVEEDFVPATQELIGMKTGGTREFTGLYVLRLFGVQNTGTSALHKLGNALIQLFNSTTFSIDGLRVRGDVAPFPQQIRNDKPGWANLTVTIPWRLFTLN